MKQLQELKEAFLLEIKNIVVVDDIPEDLIINFDQTGLNYVPVTSWTMEEVGARRVERWWLTMINGSSLQCLQYN